MTGPLNQPPYGSLAGLPDEPPAGPLDEAPHGSPAWRPPRRYLLRGGAALGAAAGLAGLGGLVPAPAGSGGRDALRIGYLPITDGTPLLVAAARRLYAAGGVPVARPVLFRGWAALAEAFTARQVDVVHLLMPFALQLRYAAGAAVRIVAWSHTNGSALTVAPDVTDLTELAGRTVAIPYWWSIHNIALQEMLRAAGLRPVIRRQPSAAGRTVRLIVLNPPDMLPALDSGTIGGFIVADPFNAAAEARGVGRILRFTGDVWREHACCVVAVHQDLIDAAPERVTALVGAVAAAQLYAAAHRGPTARLLAGGYLPQPVRAITRALDYPAAPYQRDGALRHPDWQGERVGFQPFPFPSFTERLVTAMHGTLVDGDSRFADRLDPAAVHRQVVDDRFARAALARLGGPAAFGLPPSLSRTEEVDPR